MILLDTNVVSEALKPAPVRQVVDWLNVRFADCAISSLVVFELNAGVSMLEPGRRRDALETAVARKFDDLGRASIRSISPRPKRRHEPSAWRALRDWESIKFPESWLICKLPASQSRTDFNLRPTISATSRDLVLISSIPGPATNDGERCGRQLVFATSAPPPPAASIARSARKGLYRPGNKSARGCHPYLRYDLE